MDVSSAKKRYQQLMAPGSFETADLAKRFDQLGLLIDISGVLARKDGVDRALTICSELEHETLSREQHGMLHYFCANAWNHRRTISSSDRRAWEQQELEHEILQLRHALSYLDSLPAMRRCQIFTNLGNALSNCGRFLDAMYAWNQALGLDHTFGMAVGNRAVELSWYAQMSWQRHDQVVLLQESYAELLRALALRLEGDARQSFLRQKRWLERHVRPAVLRNRHDLKTGDLGKSEAENSYRRWCLAHHLFMHPVNDLGPYPAGASDPVTLPGITVSLGKGPCYVGFFNAMKQEFASARYLLFAGSQAAEVHFSDRGVSLANTLDYPSYSVATEQIKASFRMAYSLFDKVAFFLNDYLSLGIPENKVTFRTFWYEEKKNKKVLRANLYPLRHSPLRALFWLAKDLYERDSGLPDSMEPEAHDLAVIRNHLEHKYVKVHLENWPAQPTPENVIARLLFDTLAFSVRREDFTAKTIRLLQLARAALFYLACTVNVHERDSAKSRPTTRSLPMELQEWPDDWKR